MRIVRGLMLLSLLSSIVSAQDAPPANAERPAQMTGLLTAVDAGKQTISLGRANDLVIFRVSPETRVLIDDRPGKLEDLKTDAKVRVLYAKIDPQPYLAVQILDEATVILRDAENQGVAATIAAIAEKDGGTVVTVDTALGQRRDLAVSTEGRWQSQIMKAGEPATAAAFAAGDKVMISLRRSRGATWNLKALADPVTFLAFLSDRNLRGTLREKSDDGRIWTLAVPGREQLNELLVTRATLFYQGGKAVEANPFELGQEVLVKFQTISDGQVQVQAVIEPASWQAYGEAELARRTAAE